MLADESSQPSRVPAEECEAATLLGHGERGNTSIGGRIIALRLETDALVTLVGLLSGKVYRLLSL